MSYEFLFGEMQSDGSHLNIGARILEDGVHIGKMRIFVLDKKKLDEIINFLLVKETLMKENQPKIDVQMGDIQKVVE